MIDIANKFYESGLSTIPIGENKIPFGEWKSNQTSLIAPDSRFTSSKLKGVGIVCGKVSGNLECLDIDLKYDISGTLWKEYREAIKLSSPDLPKKLVIEQTPTGGYHFIYRCSEISGNQKLANRYTTEEEKKLNPKEKVKVLLETRGEGEQSKRLIQ